MEIVSINYLETNGILLNLLGALAPFLIRRLHAQLQSKIPPRLDLLALELDYQLEQRPGAEGLAPAFGRRLERLSQDRGVGVEGHGWVASENKLDVGVLDGLGIDMAGREGESCLR